MVSWKETEIFRLGLLADIKVVWLPTCRLFNWSIVIWSTKNQHSTLQEADNKRLDSQEVVTLLLSSLKLNQIIFSMP